MFTERQMFCKLTSSISAVLILFISILASPYVNNTFNGDTAVGSMQFFVENGVFPLTEAERLPAQIQRPSPMMFAYLFGGQRSRNKVLAGSFVPICSLHHLSSLLSFTGTTVFFVKSECFNAYSSILMKTVCKRE